MKNLKIKTLIIFFFCEILLLNGCSGVKPLPKEYFTKITSRRDAYNFNNALWSPDGNRILYGVYNPKNGETKLESLDINTKKREILRGFGELRILSWSPDGNYLLVEKSREICIFNIDLKTIQECITSGIWGSWSPDGNNIAVIERLEDIWIVKIYSIQTQEEIVLRQINRDEVYSLEKVQWSPDGKYVLYIINRPIDEHINEIHLIDLETRTDSIFRKYDRLIFNPDWSPDGMFISYILSEGIIDELYISPINNQDCDIKLNIENMDIISNIQWSPDGRYFLFNWGQDIYTLDLEGLYGMPYTSLSGICPETSK